MNINQNKHNEAFKITGNWIDQSEQLKEEFLQLTDTDLKLETNSSKTG